MPSPDPPPPPAPERRARPGPIGRLQAWCLYVLLVATGTLGGALGLVWLGARLGPLAPDPAAAHPLEPVVIGLVMAIAASGIGYVLLEVAGRALPALGSLLAPGLAAAAAWLGRRSPRERALWALAALACLGALAGAL